MSSIEGTSAMTDALRKTSIISAALIIQACGGTSNAPRCVPRPDIECYHGAEVVAREVLIKFGPTTPDSIMEAKTAEDIDHEEPLGSGWLWWRSATKNVPTLIGDLSTRSDVENVEP